MQSFHEHPSGCLARRVAAVRIESHNWCGRVGLLNLDTDVDLISGDRLLGCRTFYHRHQELREVVAATLPNRLRGQRCACR